jgi:steroid 5-alpha reductase family enzyme
VLSPVAWLAISWLGAAVVMMLLWVWSSRSRSSVDAARAGCTALTGALAVVYATQLDGMVGRRLAIASMVASWCAWRLVYIVYARMFVEGSPEGSATPTRERPGRVSPLASFQAFAAVAVVLSLPALVASTNGDPDFSLLELAGAALWLAAFAGASTADRQLLHFRSDPEHAGQVCAVGLWKYSRHPDAFCDSLLWTSIALFACASPWGIATIASPLVVLFLIFRRAGIRAADEELLQKFGGVYAAYRDTTSAFIPWPPKTAAHVETAPSSAGSPASPASPAPSSTEAP